MSMQFHINEDGVDITHNKLEIKVFEISHIDVIPYGTSFICCVGVENKLQHPQK